MTELERLEELQKKSNRLFEDWITGKMSNSEYDRVIEPIHAEMKKLFDVILKRA